MQISFATSEQQPRVEFDLGAPGAQLIGPHSDHRPELKRERRHGEYVWTRNGIHVPNPDLVRWVYFRFSDDRPDLEGEVARPQTFRLCAEASVRKWGGWIDLNHWSRSSRFPQNLAAAGRSPVEFIVGKLTEIRVDTSDTSWAEGYLWPASVNMPEGSRAKMHEHADMAWGWLQHAPDMVHCSAGGPIVKHKREKRDGRWVTPIDIYLNHLAICTQGVHTDTAVRTRPWGAFASAAEASKAVTNGIMVDPLAPVAPGGFEHFLRSLPEGRKAVTSCGLHGAGMIPEDLEQRATETTKGPLNFDQGPMDCGHWVEGQFPTDHDAVAHMTECLRWTPDRARRYLKAARNNT